MNFIAPKLFVQTSFGVQKAGKKLYQKPSFLDALDLFMFG